MNAAKIVIPPALARLGYSEFDPVIDDELFWLVDAYLETLGYSKAEAKAMVLEYKQSFAWSEEDVGHDGPAGTPCLSIISSGSAVTPIGTHF